MEQLLLVLVSALRAALDPILLFCGIVAGALFRSYSRSFMSSSVLLIVYVLGLLALYSRSGLEMRFYSVLGVIAAGYALGAIGFLGRVMFFRKEERGGEK